MKKIAVTALKGGVGKSSVVAGLGSALVSKGYKVGFIDLDVTGSNLYSALGLTRSPKFGLDSVNERIVVPEVNGYWLLSIASYTGEDYAVLWESDQHKELSQIRDTIETTDLKALKRQIDDILASSKWRFVKELLSPDIVTWPEPLDFMIADLPPSTSHEMFSFFDQVKDLFGVFIVSQPSAISNTGLQRTIDLLRVRRIPILGLVANQDGFLCKHGEIEYQFLSPKVDLRDIAKKAGIPFLASIPQTGDKNKIKPYFSELADKVVSSKPVVLKDVTMVKKLKRRIVKGIVRRL
ncbi:Iron-sulfur cluster carrier protein [subsurface metagenome]